MRGKLIYLLHSVKIPLMTDNNKHRVGEFMLREHEASVVADHLIANGVTVQQWIPVSERLPKEDTRVLVYINIEKTDANIYTVFDTDRILYGKWVRWNKYISHWMPLPKPPKEVEE